MRAQAMRALLAPVRVYGDSSPNLDAELQVYAEEIELLYSQLDELLRERFIGTARDLGLRVYEELFGPERSGESVEHRREMLNLRINLGGGDFTLSGIEKALDSFGLSYTISEFPDIDKLNINATSDYTQAEQEFIRSEVSKIISPSVEFQLTFNTMTWDEIDALDKTFAESDSDGLTWDELDERISS